MYPSWCCFTRTPSGHLNRLHSFMNFTIGGDLTTILVTAEDVHPRIGWVLEHAQHAAGPQPSPYNLPIPRTALSPPGKSESPFRKSLYHPTRAPRSTNRTNHHSPP